MSEILRASATGIDLRGARIGLLTASASRAGGGVFEAVAAQAAMIRGLGGKAVVFALADEHSAADGRRLAPSPVHLHEVTGSAQIGYARGLVKSLLAADLDCLHLHGIWMYPSRAGGQWARQTGRPYLISPHGMLDPWITARGRWKKALARVGYERESWRAAGVLHALTEREATDVARETRRREIVVIPNAGPAVSQLDNGPRAPHVVYIGRIHPKKNLLALVAAWQRARLPKDSRLTIAGWGARDDVATLRAAIGDGASGIDLPGPVYGPAKQALLANARFTILPSLSEGLPMAVLEGWAAGAPAIMTEACNLPIGFATGAALACGADVAAIAETLTQGLALDERQWQTMAEAARSLAAGPFAVGAVAARWAEVYAALMFGASRNDDQ